MKNKIDVTVDKKRNAMKLTLECATIQSLIVFIDNIKLDKLNVNNLSQPSYLPYIISSGVIECIRAILPELNQGKCITYTKNLALGIGIITSSIVSSGFNGTNFFISFSISLLKSTVSTLVIDKLNKLKTIDGISLMIVLSCLFSIPKVITGVATGGLVTTLLFLLSLGAVFVGNYKFLKSTEDIDMHYKDKTDKFSLSCRNTCTTSLMISSMIVNLLPTASLVSNGLMLIICPLIQWMLSKQSIDVEELNKNIQINNIYLDGQKHGKETISVVKKMIMKNSLKLGTVSAVVFILSSLIIKIFAISISAITLSCFVNSLMTVTFGVKTMIKSNKLSHALSCNNKEYCICPLKKAIS